MGYRARFFLFLSLSTALLLSAGVAMASFQPALFEQAARLMGFEPREQTSDTDEAADFPNTKAMYSIGPGAQLKNIDSSIGKSFTKADMIQAPPKSDFPIDYYMSERKFPAQVPGSGLQAYDTNRAWGGVSSSRRSTSLGRRRCGRR